MAEKEYIERKAAIAKIKDKINEYPHNSNPYWISNDDYIVRGLREAIEIIDEYTPTANVQEIRYGSWIKKHLGYGEYYYKCSHCSTKVGRSYIEDFGHKNFCPDCGSKMDGGKTNV